MEGRVEILEDKELYSQLHYQVFGTNNGKVPEVVYVAKTKDGVIGGFVAGHWEMTGIFYIEYAGALPEFRRKGWLRYIKMLLDPRISYLTVTEHTHTLIMKTLLSVGFIPVGSRYHDDTFYIEWARQGVKNG